MSTTLLELADDVLDRGGVAIRVAGRLVVIDDIGPDPFALLGVRFGSPVDAVAVALRPDDGPVLVVDRCGEAMLVDTHRSGSPVAGAPLLLDLARRSLGLATAPPETAVAELVETVWLDRVLRATLDAPLGEPPGWVALSRLHPCAPTAPVASPEVLRHRVMRTPSWRAVRCSVAERRTRWPPVSSPLAAWFDDGSFARHAQAMLPDPGVLLGDLHDLLRPPDAARIAASLSR